LYGRAKRLDFDEDYDDDLIGSTRTHARPTLVVYTLLTVTGAYLKMAGAPWSMTVNCRPFWRRVWPQRC
jgi:hypothetical protein